MRKGSKHSDESKVKIGLAGLGRKHTPEAIEKIIQAGRRPCSEETKRKISEAKKGKRMSQDAIDRMRITKIGSTTSKKGKKFGPLSFETRQKMSDAHKGEKCHLWKGGITKENHQIRNSFEYNEWRNSCFIRDNYTCKKTNVRGDDLEVHHINNFSEFPELRFEISNGVTLSKESHKQFHLKYGYKNNTKEQLDEFLSITE